MPSCWLSDAFLRASAEVWIAKALASSRRCRCKLSKGKAQKRMPSIWSGMPERHRAVFKEASQITMPSTSQPSQIGSTENRLSWPWPLLDTVAASCPRARPKRGCHRYGVVCLRETEPYSRRPLKSRCHLHPKHPRSVQQKTDCRDLAVLGPLPTTCDEIASPPFCGGAVQKLSRKETSTIMVLVESGSLASKRSPSSNDAREIRGVRGCLSQLCKACPKG